ncbi:MAG TPA: hypothetical protein VK034_04915 [Enhygromyxa sp.]|nr:hypothetical protein [Enhygromyxa sp.]
MTTRRRQSSPQAGLHRGELVVERLLAGGHFLFEAELVRRRLLGGDALLLALERGELLLLAGGELRLACLVEGHHAAARVTGELRRLRRP